MLHSLKKVKGYLSKAPTILKAGHPILKVTSDPLTLADLQTDRFYECIQKMRQVFQSPWTPVVGLSAPQVGFPMQIIAFEIQDPQVLKDKKVEAVPLTFIINPKMTILDKLASHQWTAEYESCESVPNYNALVRRANSIHVKGWDLDGRPMEYNANGLLSRIIQHEMDHLQGILFLEKMVEKSFRHDHYIDEYDQFVR